VAGVFSLAVLCALPLASAQLSFSADENISHRFPLAAGKVGKDHIAFLWKRKFPPGAVPFNVVATCTRFNVESGFIGANKIIYKDIEMEGQESGNKLSLPKKTVKLKQGLAKNFLIWDVSAEIQTLFSADSIVLISGTMVWKKRVGAGDNLACNLNMIEGDFDEGPA